MWFLAQRNSLRYHIHATDYDSRPHRDKGAQGVKSLGDLVCELAGWGHDEPEEGLGFVHQRCYLSAVSSKIDMPNGTLKDWQGKSCSLAAARLSKPNYIPPLQG